MNRLRDAKDSFDDEEQWEYATKVHDVMMTVFKAALQLAKDLRKVILHPPRSIAPDSEHK